MSLKNKVNKMEPRKERYSIRKLSVGAASVLIGLTFMGVGNTHSVSAATQNPEDAEESTETSKVEQGQQNKNSDDASNTLANTSKQDKTKVVIASNNSDALEKAKSALPQGDVKESGSLDKTKDSASPSQSKTNESATATSSAESQSMQVQSLNINKNKLDSVPKDIASEKVQETTTTIKKVDVSAALSSMDYSISSKDNSTLNISGSFTDHGFNVTNVTDGNGNKIDFTTKDGKLSLDFSKLINVTYNTNSNNPYQIPTFKNLDIDLSKLKSTDITAEGTLNNNYDLTSYCSYDGGPTITPTYKSMGRIIPTNKNDEDILYPFTKVYYDSNYDQNTGFFKTVLSSQDSGDLATPLTITLPKIDGYTAVDDNGNAITSIKVNNILKDTAVRYTKNNPSVVGNLNIYPITDIASSDVSVMSPVMSISLNQNKTITFDPTFISGIKSKLPSGYQDDKYNTVIDSTGKRITSIDLNTIADKSKDIDLFLVCNAIDPMHVEVKAGQSKEVDVDSKNNYQLFDENGSFVEHKYNDGIVTEPNGKKEYVNAIDMKVANSSGVLYPSGITTISNSGDASYINMVGTMNTSTGKYDPVSLPAYSEDGKRVIGNWQVQLGDSTYGDSGYSDIIHVTFNSTDKTYEGNVQPLYIEGSSDGGPNPMIATVDAVVTLQHAAVKFIDDNAYPQDLSSYNENASGAIGDPISFATSVKKQINRLQELGYMLVSDNFDDGTKSTNYSDIEANNNFVVHVNHGLKLGQSISQTVTRTIHYQGIDENGKKVDVNGSPENTSSYTQSVTFRQQPVIDAITGKTIGYDTNQDTTTPEVTVTDADRAWMPQSVTLPAVQSQVPSKVGYDHVDYASVDGIPQVYPNQKLNDVTVTYTLSPRYKQSEESKTITRTIHYLDKVTGQPIANNHYVPKGIVNDVTQTATLNHATILDKNGKFVAYGIVDANDPTKITQKDVWTINENGWIGVKSPDLSKYGYTAADKDVEGVNVNENTPDRQVINVYYDHTYIPVKPDSPKKTTDPINPNNPQGVKYPANVAQNDLNQTITRTIKYMGINQDGSTTPVNGSMDGKNIVTQTVKFTRTAIVDAVTGQLMGYDTDNDGKVDTANADRAWMPQSATLLAVQSQTPSKVMDKDGNAFTLVDKPIVESTTLTPNDKNGVIIVTYKRQIGKANLIIVDADNNMKQIIVDGVPTSFNAQGVVGTAIDFGNTTNSVNALTNKGYVYDSTNFKAGTKFDDIADTNGDSQTFQIIMKHKLVPVTPKNPGNGLNSNDLTRTINETVHYVVSGDQSKAPVDHIAKLHFDGIAYYDSVTKKWTDSEGNELQNQNENITWTPEDGTKFDTVVSPVITGYRVVKVTDGYNDGNGNVKEVSGINQNSDDINVTVTYAPVTSPKTQQVAQLVIQDVTPGQEKRLDNYTQFGLEGNSITFRGAQEVINNLLDKEGYAWDGVTYNGTKLDANSYAKINFGNYDNKSDEADISQTWVINLIHTSETKDITKTVTRDVTYIYEDNSQAADPVHQAFTFNGKTTTDKVTGNVQTTWNNNSHKFDATKSIDTDKYVIVKVNEINTSANVDMNNGVVNSETIKPTSQDSQVIIVLAKKPTTPVEKGTVVITYIDKTAGSTLETTSMTGDEGTNVNYSTKSTIDKYIDQGYKLEKDGYPVGAVIYTKSTQNYEVDLIHDLVPVNPENPVTPGKPINPKYPNGPKYPDGTRQDELSRTITRTIKYVGEGLNIPTSYQEIHFVASGILDKVTGQWLAPLTWKAKSGKSDSGVFEQVIGPNTKGYYITNVYTLNEDLDDIDRDTGTVASKQINHKNNNIVIEIDYAKKPTSVPGTPNEPQLPNNNPVPDTPNKPQIPNNDPVPETPKKPETPKIPDKEIPKKSNDYHKESSIKENKKLISNNWKRVQATKAQFNKLVNKLKQDSNSVPEPKGTEVNVQQGRSKLPQANKLPQTGTSNEHFVGDVGLAILAAGSVILAGLFEADRKRKYK